nr:immunoglobulin light chain junction region [Macaca mulatta]MOW09173.1 immunoglobulin light chain junction region [Macaca mulatta]MOW11047.1 immunoglobulin light chain junction region [Macaca mulatta]MOW13550.1 immunoglobulin light chain junction region [Macaca mulatta]
CLQYNFSPFTF